MHCYTISNVSNILCVNTETVRRWIRSGKLKANMTSKKTGYLISEYELNRFVNHIPKYKIRLEKSGLSLSDTYREPTKDVLHIVLDKLKQEQACIDECISIIETLLEEA